MPAACLQRLAFSGDLTRHIDIRRYYARELVFAGMAKLIPLGSHLQHHTVADTQSLPLKLAFFYAPI